MGSKCPPGVFCVENLTMSYLIISILLFGIIIYLANSKNSGTKDSVVISPQPAPMMSAGPPNVLQDPHVPPLRDTRTDYPPAGRGVQINIPTQGQDTAYRQVGILTRITGTETILPLMGRPLIVNRDKWQFYTMSDQNNSVKFP